jgi:hypothetical protein
MLTSAELGTIALGSCSKATAYLLECLSIKDLQNPTEDEARAVVQGLAMCIGYMELFLKLHLPPEEQPHVRDFISALSSGMADHVRQMQEKAVDTPPPSGIIDP